MSKGGRKEVNLLRTWQ